DRSRPGDLPAAAGAGAQRRGGGGARGARRRRPARVLGRPGPGAAHLGDRVRGGPRLVGRALRALVHRRPAERLRQRRRPPRGRRPGRPGGLPLGRRARRHPHHHLQPAARAGAARRRRPGGPRRPARRPGGHLPAHGLRGDRRDARLRPGRRPALGGVLGLLRRGAAHPHRGRRGARGDHRGRRLPAGGRRPAEARGGRGARRGGAERGARARRPAHGGRGGLDRGARRVVARRPRGGARDPRGAGVRRRAPAVHPLHLGHHGEAQGHPPHHRRLPHPGRAHPPHRLRPAPRDRRVLVRGRRRLGHRPHLHRLRAAAQRGHVGGLRGHAQHPARGPVVGDRAAVRGEHPLHRADDGAHLHEVGRAGPGPLRPVEPAAAGQRRRADQPRGVALVPPEHRRRPHPGRRHLVADRDRRHHDQPAARGDHAEARVGADPAAGDQRRGRRRRGRGAGRRRRRDHGLPGAHRAVARHAPRHLGRRAALPRHLLVAVPGPVLRRRRRPPRRRRRHLAAGARGRRHERLRAPDLDHRGGVGAGQPPRRGRGRGGRGRRRDHRAGHRRLRHPARRGRRGRRGGRRRRPAAGAAPARGDADQPDRQAALGARGRRAAQDPLGQDHAPAAARRGGGPRGGRRDHAGRRHGDGADLRGPARRARGGL
ncbi:MAG: Acetyl-CoA synthetase, partial [uncultured Quadrisphaera sp.]